MHITVIDNSNYTVDGTVVVPLAQNAIHNYIHNSSNRSRNETIQGYLKQNNTL